MQQQQQRQQTLCNDKKKAEIKIGIENVCYWLKCDWDCKLWVWPQNDGSGTTFIMDVRVTIDTLGKV